MENCATKILLLQKDGKTRQDSNSWPVKPYRGVELFVAVVSFVCSENFVMGPQVWAGLQGEQN